MNWFNGRSGGMGGGNNKEAPTYPQPEKLQLRVITSNGTGIHILPEVITSMPDQSTQQIPKPAVVIEQLNAAAVLGPYFFNQPMLPGQVVELPMPANAEAAS